MAMTREEEKELRLSCSIGTLLGSLGNREDLKKPPPPPEEREDDGEGGVKRSGDEAGGVNKKVKDEEETRAIEYFLEETPDFEEDDPDWVIEEKKYLIDEYGKKTITLGFDDRDNFIYTCEICNVECNRRKMLESHCLGMRHLRKKKLHDLKIQGKEVPETFKISKSANSRSSKPLSKTKPVDKDEEGAVEKKKWHSKKNYYNYGQDGNNPGFQPPYGPPPGYGGPPSFPPSGPPPPGFYGQWGSNAPNIFSTPPPTLDNKPANKNSLAGGDTGSLLQKLADCAVKNDKDSDLAINVVIALMKSLKDFNHKRGETKFIEVLTEADVTFRILKTLKPANKEVDDASPPSTTPTGDVLQDQNSSSSTTCGVSDFVQSNPSGSQSSSYPVNNQYYNSQNNPASNPGYNYGNGSEYSSPVPTGVPPPSATNYNNSRDTNGYSQGGTDQNYGQNSAQANNQNYPSQNYSNQGYGNQGPNAPQASSGYYNQGQNSSGGFQGGDGYSNQGSFSQATGSDYYNKGPQSTQSSEDTSSNPGGQQKGTGDNASNQSQNAPPPPPPPPPAADSSTPDFSNYGYAAGYSMGYYNVPPPTYNNQQY